MSWLLKLNQKGYHCNSQAPDIGFDIVACAASGRIDTFRLKKEKKEDISALE
jgi:hypothetical protein